MVVRKKKKFRKFRGKRSYGYGSHKKHRGGGSRGGRGKAGMHKHKWSYTVKYDPDHFGTRGFKSKTRKIITPVNVSALEQLAAGKKRLDVGAFGYNKVLGNGRINAAIEVTSKAFSKKAVEKIEEAGGKVVVLSKAEDIAEEKPIEKVGEEVDG